MSSYNSIKPGTLCLVRFSVFKNEGKIVTAVEHFPNIRVSNGQSEYTRDCWKVEPPLNNGLDLIEAQFLVPLDTPGDDEVDMFPLSKNMTNNYYFSKEKSREC